MQIAPPDRLSSPRFRHSPSWDQWRAYREAIRASQAVEEIPPAKSARMAGIESCEAKRDRKPTGRFRWTWGSSWSGISRGARCNGGARRCWTVSGGPSQMYAQRGRPSVPSERSVRW